MRAARSRRGSAGRGPAPCRPERRRGTRRAPPRGSAAISASIVAEITTQPAPSSLARASTLRGQCIAGRGRAFVDVADVEHRLARSAGRACGTAFSSSGLRSTKRAGLPSRSSASDALDQVERLLGLLVLAAPWPSSPAHRRASPGCRGRRASARSRWSRCRRPDRCWPSTWVTSSSSKQRTTWAMASTSRMLARNWLPSPSPFDAPRTRPAMSTKVSRVGTISADLASSASSSSRGSGTAHDADVRLDGAERIVRRLRRRGLGQRIEQRRLADIGQADDAAFEAHDVLLLVFLSVRRLVVWLTEALGVHGEMHLVLEARVLAARQQLRIVRDDVRTAPRPRHARSWRSR